MNDTTINTTALKCYALDNKNKGQVNIVNGFGTSYIKGPPPTLKPVHWVYSKDQLDAIWKFAENTMKMLYLFFSLAALQLLLASPIMVRKQQTENGVGTVSSEINKTASKSTELKAHPFLFMQEQNASSRASSLQHNQVKCKRDKFIVLISVEEHAKF